MPTSSATAHNDLRLLLVDPSENDRRLVAGLLALAPGAMIDIVPATGGTDAAQRLATGNVDAILLAATPGQADGWEELLLLLRLQRAPVLVISSVWDADTAVECLKLGAADCLCKSRLTGASLFRAIRESLARWDRRSGSLRPLYLCEAPTEEPGRNLRLRSLTSDEHRAPATGAAPAREQPSRKPVAPGHPAVPAVTVMAHVPRAAATAAPPPAPRPPPAPAAPTTPVAAPVESAAPATPTPPAPAPAPAAAPAPPAPPASQIRGYSTRGIDAAMASFGIVRPKLLSDVLIECRRQTSAVLLEMCSAPKPAHFGLLVQVASNLHEHVHDIRDGHNAFAFSYQDEDYFGGNAVQVGLLTNLLVDQRPELEDHRVDLVVAGLLHDAGFLSTADRQPSANPAALAEHVRVGAQFAAAIGAPALTQSLILQHEEHADGSGLPERMKGNDLPVEAQLLTMAVTYTNVYYGHFDAGCKPDKPAYRGVRITSKDAMTCILMDLRTWFRPDVLKSMIFENGFYSNGSVVQLTNMGIGHVISQNPGKPNAPVVEIMYRGDGSRPENITLIDLSKEPALAIAKVLSGT